MSVEGGVLLGGFTIRSVDGRGFTPEEIAESAVDKIIYVGTDSHPLVREQAQAFKDRIRVLLVAYFKEVVASHNTTVANRLREAGHPELIKLLEI
jgi:acyl carrier protein phosphodiesterase